MFSELLQQMVRRIEGVKAVAIIGLDGMIVDRCVVSYDSDLELVAAEYSSLLGETVKTASDTGLGDLKETIVSTDQSIFFVKILSPEYFVLLIGAENTSLGRARFEMRKAQLILEHEFIV